ncbi:MAG: ABC transporter permease subunit [Armatimonadetes bacterium]|nr:ABC transporter permease subunit [Armatimonadota bacterium]
MKQIIAIAGTTIGEAIRRKVLLVILLVGLVFLIVAPSLGALSARSETTILRATMLGIIQLTSAVIAIVLTVYMIPNEIERRTIYTILSKPVQRWQFLLGKYLGAVGALALMMLFMTIVMIAVFTGMQNGDFGRAVTLAQATMMFFVQMSLLAAVAVCFSTFVTPLVNFFLSGGIYLAGSLFAPMFDSLSKQQNTSQFSKTVTWAMTTFLPNFSYYNVQNPLINPSSTIQNPMSHYLFATGYGLMYISLLLFIGHYMFDHREV